MKSARNISIVLVTAPNLRTARKLAAIVLQERKAACANILPQVESHFWWKEKKERSREVIIIFKTTSILLPELEKLLLENHPYETPEIIAVPVASGTPKYLGWILESVR